MHTSEDLRSTNKAHHSVVEGQQLQCRLPPHQPTPQAQTCHKLPTAPPGNVGNAIADSKNSNTPEEDTTKTSTLITHNVGGPEETKTTNVTPISNGSSQQTNPVMRPNTRLNDVMNNAGKVASDIAKRCNNMQKTAADVATRISSSIRKNANQWRRTGMTTAATIGIAGCLFAGATEVGLIGGSGALMTSGAQTTMNVGHKGLNWLEQEAKIRHFNNCVTQASFDIASDGESPTGANALQNMASNCATEIMETAAPGSEKIIDIVTKSSDITEKIGTSSLLGISPTVASPSSKKP